MAVSVPALYGKLSRWRGAAVGDLDGDAAAVLAADVTEDVVRAGTPARDEVDEVGVVACGFDLVEAVAERED
ncbi:hypothetical protein C482_04626 [Natrialba chahannaoensis JCM 10990]|uniref:Uncharacterized protein n=1 Tax=Natrialba chahannaoensis JCM 10990 TaxID=1227492 RepID=M0AZQ0_9EURY|nr:hypothetical protein C482_04626 [Natrialba chahannaoensis JCM 10990]